MTIAEAIRTLQRSNAEMQIFFELSSGRQFVGIVATPDPSAEVLAIRMTDAKEGALPFYVRAESIVLLADGTKGDPETDAESQRNMRRAKAIAKT
jgi:hypothetical protein